MINYYETGFFHKKLYISEATEVKDDKLKTETKNDDFKPKTKAEKEAGIKSYPWLIG